MRRAQRAGCAALWELLQPAQHCKSNKCPNWQRKVAQLKKKPTQLKTCSCWSWYEDSGSTRAVYIQALLRAAQIQHGYYKHNLSTSSVAAALGSLEAPNWRQSTSPLHSSASTQCILGSRPCIQADTEAFVWELALSQVGYACFSVTEALQKAGTEDRAGCEWRCPYLYTGNSCRFLKAAEP